MSLKENSNPYESLARCGLDIHQLTCVYDDVIYMLDDAEYRYDYPSFWDVLIQNVQLYFDAGGRFIISATHVISVQNEWSLTDLQQLETIHREDLLLSDDQSQELLGSTTPLGLSTTMQNYLQLKKTIVEHCEGLIGALCKSVAFYADQFRHRVPTEVECLRAFIQRNSWMAWIPDLVPLFEITFQVKQRMHF